MDVRKAYRWFDIPMKEYILRFVLPLAIIGFLLPLVMVLFVPGVTGTIAYVAMIGIPVLIAITVLVYPIILAERRAREIEEEMHLFVVRMSVLTTKELTRSGFVDHLEHMKEYRALSEEIDKIFVLVKKWKLTLAESSRIVSRTTPSKLFSDFLERLAYSIEGGMEAGEFFKNEQKVVLDTYAIIYEGSLSELDILKELFIALVTASVFIIAVVAFIPILTGVNAITLMLLAVFLFHMIEGGFLYIFSTLMPKESIWHTLTITTKLEIKIQYYFFIGAFSTAGIAIALGALWIPIIEPAGYGTVGLLPFYVALCVTPLALPGYLVIVEEARIKRKDENYPAFIRSLGGSAEARSVGAPQALKKLTRHDFGPLTNNIKDLNKRISTGIDAERSWEYFGAEAESDLISKFSDMYVEGWRVGGSPRAISALISDNFVKLNGLRKKRYQSSADLTGVLYGLLIAISFPLYITMGILEKIQEMYMDIRVPEGFENVEVLESATFNISLYAIIILGLIITHSVISALMTRIATGGHKMGALLHFVIFLWVGACISFIVTYLLAYLFP